MSIITVTASTGNIGLKLSKLLLKDGHKVRAIARNKTNLDSLASLGAEILVGELSDTQFLIESFAGSDAVFSLIPPDFQAEDFRKYQNVIGESIGNAIMESGVKRVVNLSSLSAHYSKGVGPSRGLHDHEVRLNSYPELNIRHIRPGYFYENLLFSLQLIKEQNILGTPLGADVAFFQTGTQEIAEEARDWLVQDFIGNKIVEIQGEQLSFAEIVAIISQQTKATSLSYVQFTDVQMKDGLIGSGLSVDMADNFIELYQSMADGKVKTKAEGAIISSKKSSFRQYMSSIAKLI